MCQIHLRVLINLTNQLTYIPINLFFQSFNKFYSLKQQQFHFYKDNKND